MRKKRGFTRAGGSKSSEPASPHARRRQKMASMTSPRSVDQRHQFGSGRLARLENAAHGTRGTDTVGFADPADGHARMRGFQDHADPASVEMFHEQIGKFLG